VGNLGKEVTDEMLGRAFSKYATFQKAKAVRHAKSGEHKGYGFVSFGEIGDMVKALKEMDNKYIGNRPCKVRREKSTAAATHTRLLSDATLLSPACPAEEEHLAAAGGWRHGAGPQQAAQDGGGAAREEAPRECVAR
jgi:RNA recognition motif-containing protein